MNLIMLKPRKYLLPIIVLISLFIGLNSSTNAVGPERPKCTATVTCKNSPGATCSGIHYCSAYTSNNYVSCDGKRTYCAGEEPKE